MNGTVPGLPGEDLLTPREVAEILGVRAATVGLWARIGALKPAAWTPGGHRRFRRPDVYAFRDARHPEPGSERARMEQDAVRLYRQGWSIRRVAARFDCGYGAMRRVLLCHTVLRTRNEEGGRP